MIKFGQLLRTLLITTSLLGSGAMAQTNTSLITDTVTNPDGTPFNGTLALTWTGTSAGAGAQYSTSTKIYNGVLSVRLVPSSTAYPPAFYLAVYTSADGRTSWVETWQVGPSTSALTLNQVRSAVPNTSTGPVAATVGIGQVTGLSSYLNAISNSVNTVTATVGGFNTTVGGISNSVSNLQTTVNTLAANAANNSAATFVGAEIPQGAIGGNSTFQLAQMPNPPSSVMLSNNGVLLAAGQDYALSGSTITFLAGAQPQMGDALIASYRVGTTGQTGFHDAETLRGTIDGSNMTFILTSAPVSTASLKLYKNGFLLSNGPDYTLNGSTITFTNMTSVPMPGDSLLAYYRATS